MNRALWIVFLRILASLTLMLAGLFLAGLALLKGDRRTALELILVAAVVAPIPCAGMLENIRK